MTEQELDNIKLYQFVDCFLVTNGKPDHGWIQAYTTNKTGVVLYLDIAYYDFLTNKKLLLE